MIGAGVATGVATVVTTIDRGYTADELTDMTMRRLVYVADDSPFKDQAHAFITQLRAAVHKAIVQAHADERMTVAGKLKGLGMPDVAKLVLEMT